MGFKTFTVGEVLTASDVNNHLMQGVLQVTSATRPAHVEGRVIYETDTDKMLVSDGAAWIETGDLGEWDTYSVSWTAPTTPPAIGNGTLTGRYRRAGRSVTVYIDMTAGSTTTFGSGIWRFSLPVTSRENPDQIFDLMALDISAGVPYLGIGINSLTGGNDVACYGYNGSASGATVAITGTAPFTWTTDDHLTIMSTYETT